MISHMTIRQRNNFIAAISIRIPCTYKLNYQRKHHVHAYATHLRYRSKFGTDRNQTLCYTLQKHFCGRKALSRLTRQGVEDQCCCSCLLMTRTLVIRCSLSQATPCNPYKLEFYRIFYCLQAT